MLVERITTMENIPTEGFSVKHITGRCGFLYLYLPKRIMETRDFKCNIDDVSIGNVFSIEKFLMASNGSWYTFRIPFTKNFYISTGAIYDVGRYVVTTVS